MRWYQIILLAMIGDILCETLRYWAKKAYARYRNWREDRYYKRTAQLYRAAAKQHIEAALAPVVGHYVTAKEVSSWPRG